MTEISLDASAHLDLAEPVLAALERIGSRAVADHSIRTFLFAEIIARETGLEGAADYDRNLLFAAACLHDLGLGPDAQGTQRFEVEGADLAAMVLTDAGMTTLDVDRVWEAIALHTSGGIAERRGTLPRLVRLGILADLGRHPLIDLDRAAAIHAAHPRDAVATAIVDGVVAHARRSSAAGAAYTLPGELLREREAGHPTRLEESLAPGW
jgi:hypothetical protein